MESTEQKLPSERVAEKKARSGKFRAILTRLLPPIVILAAGWYGYANLSVEPEETKREKERRKPIKTQVVELKLEDYPTSINTQGNIRPHNEITLNPEVSGQIIRISPHFEDGAFFTEGEVLVELDPSDYQAALANAEAQLARTSATYAMEKAEADQAKLNWKKLGLNEQPDDLVLRLPQMRQAEANVKAASAQLDRARRDLERTQIRAPFDGRVRKRAVGLGQAVRNVTVLGSVFASDYAEVRLPISGTDLPLLQLPEAAGDSPVAVVLSDALNPENKTEWKASIVRTEGALDANSLELFGIATVEDPFGQKSGKPPLRIGQPVTAKISGKVLKGVMALPRIAVRQMDQIYLVDGEKFTLKSMTIEPIWSNEAHIIIRSSRIADGDLLATTHLVYAPDGARVEILPGIENPVGNKIPLAGDLSKSTVKSPSKGSAKGGKF